MTKKTMTFHPSILSECADPENSTRHNAIIILEKIPTSYNKVEYYNNLSIDKKFLIRDFSNEYNKYSIEIGQGVVLIEKNNKFSWWFTLDRQRYYIEKEGDN